MQTTELGAETAVGVITKLEQVGSGGQCLFEELVQLGVSSEIASDVRLATAELATNAFEHGAARAVSVSRSIDHDSIVVRMTYVDAGVAPNPNEAVMPPPTSPRGRGLALVRALSSTVERSVVNGVTITAVTFKRSTDHSS